MKRYLLLLLLPILAFANIGKITVLRGDVTITRDGKTIKAHNGSTLEEHDFIKTAKNGKLQIIFKDKTIFTVGRNSTLDIADYLYDEAQPQNSRAQFKVLKGAFTSITGKIGKFNKKKFKLKTKSASIGIRGTIVKANQETIMCTQGAIEVTTNTGASVFVKAGQKTSVATGVPSKPTTITKSDLKSLDADITEDDKKAAKQESATTTEKAKTEEKATASQEATTETAAKTTEDTTTSTVSDKMTTTDIAADKLIDKVDEYNSGKVVKQTGYISDGSSLDTELDTQSNSVTANGQNLHVKDADSVSSWGYWDDGSGGIDHKKVWVSGVQTDVGVLNTLRNSPTEVTTTYKGQVIGNVKTASGANEAIIEDSSNAIKLDFTLGGGQNKMDGNVKFKTNSTSWNSNFTGKTSGSQFNSASVSDNGSGNDVIVNGGSVKGSFYGKDAQNVGGAVNLNSVEGHTANGVFKASK